MQGKGGGPKGRGRGEERKRRKERGEGKKGKGRGMKYRLYKHKAKSQLSVTLEQINSAYKYALDTGRWTGQALLGHYLSEHRKRYGFRLRMEPHILAQKASEIQWLSYDYGTYAPKIITTLLNSTRLVWVNNKWLFLISPTKVAETIVPIVDFESKPRRVGEQSEWTVPQESGRPTRSSTRTKATSTVEEL